MGRYNFGSLARMAEYLAQGRINITVQVGTNLRVYMRPWHSLLGRVEHRLERQAWTNSQTCSDLCPEAEVSTLQSGNPQTV
jgi:hypothetical protein